jgi:hypothetical protein
LACTLSSLCGSSSFGCSPSPAACSSTPGPSPSSGPVARPDSPDPLTPVDHLMRQFPAPRQSPRVDLPSTSAHDEKNNK